MRVPLGATAESYTSSASPDESAGLGREVRRYALTGEDAGPLLEAIRSEAPELAIVRFPSHRYELLRRPDLNAGHRARLEQAVDDDPLRLADKRIREAVSRNIVSVDGLALRTTVSIGLALFPDHDGGSLEDLMRKADEALYRAKRGGRDRVVPFAA